MNQERNILPEIATPIHYELRLKPIFENFTFDGCITVNVQFIQGVDHIVFHAADLQVKKACFWYENEKQENFKHSKEINLEEKEERVTLVFNEKFEPGKKGFVRLEFSGVISEKLAGFYRSQYKDSQGNPKWLAVTQFEPTDARRAFPCFDEPNRKAKFTVSLDVPQSHTALSNMNVEGTHASETANYKVVKFATTPLVSTYLIAFVIGELESIETVTKHGIPFRVWAPVGYVQQGKFALEVGAKILDFFTEYFEQPYPLPKMDMAAIPDFAAGAMENWGLITYRMTLLLFDEKNSTLNTKRNVTYVVGHELAHQWFGNLVTMEWWSDLWLNEGFATWVGWLSSDFLFPEWKIWNRFVLEDLSSALTLDSMRSSHPIEVPVKNPADIGQIFDAISYSKGGSVIRMLEAYLGRDVFRTGLRQYLAKYKFGNACTRDLWNSLQEASGKPVVEIMTDWTLHTGYPLLTASITDSHSISIRQNRFLSTGDVKPEDDTLVWHVPLNVALVGEKTETKNYLLHERVQEIPGGDKIVKINPGQTGFYRVLYSDKMIADLGKAIANNLIGVEDRIGVINDAFLLGQSGHSTVTKGLDLLHYLSSEKEYSVWEEVSNQLKKLKSVWFEENEQDRSRLEQLVCSLYSPIAHQLGWDYKEGESDITYMLRTLAISNAANNGDKELIASAQQRFQSFIKGDESAIHPNLRGVVFGLNIKHGSEAEHNAVFEIYQKTTVSDQKLAALAALTATRNPDLIRRNLDLSISTHVRSQDVIYIFRTIILNEAARRPTWVYLRENWDKISDKFSKGGLSLLQSIIGASTSSLTKYEDAKDIRAFFADKDTSSVSRVIEQSIEKVTISANWLQRDRKVVSEWLAANIPLKK